EAEKAIQAGAPPPTERLQENGPRPAVLQAPQLPVRDRPVVGPLNGAGNGDGSPRSKRPQISRRVETRTIQLRTRRFQADDAAEPLDVARLAGMAWTDEIILGAPADDDSDCTRTSPVEFVEISDAIGERISYPVGRLVDVYHPATEIKERIPAADVKPGMFMIVLVDDFYEDVFERLLEAIREERDIKASMAL